MRFYVWNILCAMVSIIMYASFRMGVNSYLRFNKKSKTYIGKSKKGYLNYWLYKKIDEEVGLGYIFYLNFFLLILTAFYSFLSICFAWVELLSLPVAICNAILCAFQIPAIIFSDSYCNLNDYARKFVVMEKRKFGRGYHSSFYAVFEILLILAFAVYNISLAV